MSTASINQLREVMNRLRSPGGCLWDGEQTHESLLKYLLEEAYEYIAAVESGDRIAMQEELGDLLLQVYFHARIAEEDHNHPFNLDDVAKTITDKLIHRHPHVFSGVKVSSSEQVVENWESIKKAEKKRTSSVDGVAFAQPALPLASKLIHRASTNKIKTPVFDVNKVPEVPSEQSLGQVLLQIVSWANSHGLDPESALRKAALDYAKEIKSNESVS